MRLRPSLAVYLSIALCVAIAACQVAAVTFVPPDDARTQDGPAPEDAASGVDTRPATCDDGQTNGDETDRDCGGVCGPSAVGQACGTSADCATRVCTTNQCQPALCTDEVENGDETDRDCGGSCAPCAVGQACSAPADCITAVCTGNECRAAACGDGVKNGDETDRDCGGSCGPCSDGQVCSIAGDCTSQVCTGARCQVPTCSDSTQNGGETDLDCGGSTCAPCAIGRACAASRDCASAGVCEAARCRFAQSCAEILQQHPGTASGAYTIAPAGAAAPFGAVCDMTRDRGGWTLLLKANGETDLEFAAAAWTNDSVISPGDLTTGPGNAKYPSFSSLPLTELRGELRDELDVVLYTKAFSRQTALQIFLGPADTVSPYPMFPSGSPWSTQPNCQTFGVNTPYQYARARFGWNSNQETNCDSTDMAIGLGIAYTPPLPNPQFAKGAGYICQSTLCSLGNVDQPANGLLWGR
jgi:hypothetical protein